MTQRNKVIIRLLTDLGGAVIGLLMGILCLQFFRNGVSLQLDNTDWFVLISTIFAALLLSSVFHKSIRRFLKPLGN